MVSNFNFLMFPERISNPIVDPYKELQQVLKLFERTQKWALKNEGQDSQITIFARARLKDELSFEREKSQTPTSHQEFI